jgi:hypothetical protein
MDTRAWTYGVLAAATLALTTPAMSQGIEIGRDGIRILPQEQVRERDARPERREERRRELSEREAVRIARQEGVREVDSVRRTRGTYRVVGIDRRGDDIQVDIDRRNGAVLSVR